MTYYINPIWFLIAGICEDFKVYGSILLLLTYIVALMVAAIIIFSTQFDEYKELIKDVAPKKKMIKAITTGIAIVQILVIILPTKQTCYEMMIASQVTKENVAEVTHIVDYIVEKVTNE